MNPSLTSRVRHWLSRPPIHRAFSVVALLLTVGLFCALATGCMVPTWIADANRVIPIALDAALALAATIAALSGNAEFEAGVKALQAIAAKVEVGLRDLNTLIESYKASPNTDTLHHIEEVANLVVGDLNQLLGDFGIPEQIAKPIQAAASLLLTQIEAWITLIPGMHPKVPAGTQFLVTVPAGAAEFKKAFNSALSISTGAPAIDAALATTKRLS